MAKHTECKFGKWYYGADAKQLAGIAAYQTIGEQHARFHQLARTVVELHKSGKNTEAAGKLTQVRQLSQILFGLLDELEHAANGTSVAV